MSAPQRRFPTNEEYEEEQLLIDLESELQLVQTLKLQIHQRVEQLLQDHKYLEQQQRRLQRQYDRHDTGAATARMLQLQDKERERLAAVQAKCEREEEEMKVKAEKARRNREHTIETQDGDIEDLDTFLAEDAANF
ncbi:hypothetical protein KXD40_003918 [Peronospora effusa]|uniref:Uncharacterized protein n=1 Tax=Peronospora effusa TaxID=542832 RepID=A0A3M6VW47_9STRA|nr:hypothetical protein DD238_000205 [Peronospora effusa]RQM14035.1 hypothetical protein DD237_000269 [Peronospora effusa]UIZ23210.1 hypothetical protein KXD40_003918 [Peronospora effusa]CAI5703106.1 unnamed protein product [Peronospora effusa]